MARLMDIPNELLFYIIAFIDPVHFENLSSSCRALRTKSHLELEKHKALKQRYSVVSLRSNVNRNEPVTNPFQLLQAIFEDSRIALYPRVLVFGEWHDDFEFGNVNYQRLSDQLCRAFHECPYLLDADERGWEDGLQGFDYGAAIGLLITLLPNLRTLVDDGSKCEHWRPQKRSVGFMVSRIVEIIQSNRPDPERTPALRNLSKIEASSDYVFNHTNRLEVILKLSRLPSITQLNLFGTKCRNKLCWTTDTSVSRPTTPHEAETLKRPILKEHLLPYGKHLKHFIYHQGFNEEMCWEPRAFVKELLLTSKNSLERLELQTVNQLGFSHYHTLSTNFRAPSFKPDPQIGTLRDFSALKFICLQAANVVVQDIEERGRLNRPLRLIDILPFSVETLDIVNQVEPDEVEKLLDGLSEVAKQKFPKLQRIDLNREAGITLGFGALAIEEDCK